MKIEYQLKSIKSPALHRWTSNPTQGFDEAIKGKWNFMQWNLTEIVITIVKAKIVITIIDIVIS